MDHRVRPEAVRRSNRSRAKNSQGTRAHGESKLFRLVKAVSTSPKSRLMACMQAELEELNAAGRSSTSVKREQRSPSPIVVKNPGEVVDLTLDD